MHTRTHAHTRARLECMLLELAQPIRYSSARHWLMQSTACTDLWEVVPPQLRYGLEEGEHIHSDVAQALRERFSESTEAMKAQNLCLFDLGAEWRG